MYITSEANQKVSHTVGHSTPASKENYVSSLVMRIKLGVREHTSDTQIKRHSTKIRSQ